MTVGEAVTCMSGLSESSITAVDFCMLVMQKYTSSECCRREWYGSKTSDYSHLYNKLAPILDVVSSYSKVYILVGI